MGGGTIAAYHYTLDGNHTDIDQEVSLSIDLSVINTTFAGNPQKNRLVSAGSDTFTFDDEGQLQTAYGSTLTFYYEHRLTEITGASTTQYKYDGAGNCNLPIK